jgi:hypothetical protein
MGTETTCTATFARATASGKALLESDRLEFRGGDLRVSVPFKDVKQLSVRAGTLAVKFSGGLLSLGLGAAAARWAEKIQNPPSRLSKLGVKAGHQVSLVNVDDRTFAVELEEAGAVVMRGRLRPGRDMIFYGASRERDLARVPALKALLQPTGALWIIRPKGRPEVSEKAVMLAGRAAGLVDVKVVSFSATATAEKFVIPVAGR